MKKIMPLMLATLAAVLLLAGCVTVKPDSSTLFDFGSLPVEQANALPTLPPISVADIDVPTWLDRRMMHFRLGYANDQQPRFYSQSRWVAPPAELIEQRLKARITRAGGVALPASAGTIGVPVLRIEVQEFTQVFTSPQQSTGQVSLRASLFEGRKLIAQKAFTQHADAPSADATGGARALATANDAVIASLITWLGSLPLE